MLAIPIGMQGQLMLYICIFLITNEVEHFFMNLFVIQTFPLVKYLFKSFFLLKNIEELTEELLSGFYHILRYIFVRNVICE